VSPEPTFFVTQADFRAWLEKHHESSRELWVGFHKKAVGRPSITWPEAVDEALCFGWIDGVRKSIDAESYMNRFTPRKPGSIWSDVNVRRARELSRLGLMSPAGRAAFRERTEARTAVYSYEQRNAPVLGDAYERQLRANPQAWDFFQSQPPGYRKAATWWVISAKKEETRQRRLGTLIEDSARGRRVPPLTPPGKPSITK
jgi:uncharacterized protein YdeI (YjbR/CyaY-like superfamily)